MKKQAYTDYIHMEKINYVFFLKELTPTGKKLF